MSRTAAGPHPAMHSSGSYLQEEDVIFGNGFHQVLVEGGFTTQAASLSQSLMQQAALPARPLPVEEDIGSVFGEERGDVADRFKGGEGNSGVIEEVPLDFKVQLFVRGWFWHPIPGLPMGAGVSALPGVAVVVATLRGDAGVHHHTAEVIHNSHEATPWDSTILPTLANLLSFLWSNKDG